MGSQVAPLVAEAYLWKADQLGIDAQGAILNAGTVRNDIHRGDLTLGQIYELLPFSETLVALDLSGRQIRSALTHGVSRSLASPDQDGAFPYVAGMRYIAAPSRTAEGIILSLDIQRPDGTWQAVADQQNYRIIVSKFLASGGDGYDVLAKASGYRYDTGFAANEVFMEWATKSKILDVPAIPRVKLQNVSPPSSTGRSETPH